MKEGGNSRLVASSHETTIESSLIQTKRPELRGRTSAKKTERIPAAVTGRTRDRRTKFHGARSAGDSELLRTFTGAHVQDVGVSAVFLLVGRGDRIGEVLAEVGAS